MTTTRPKASSRTPRPASPPAAAGIGYAGDRLFASGGVTIDDSRYGIPFAGELHGHHHDEEDGHTEEEGEHDDILIDLDSQRAVGRFDVGMRNLSHQMLESFRVTVSAIDWQHDELEIEEGTETVGTTFDNRTYIVRAEMRQRQTNRLSGKLGVWSQFRDYVATGEEALAPRTGSASTPTSEPATRSSPT